MRYTKNEFLAMDYYQQLKILEDYVCSYMIKFLKNPTEEMQLRAIESNVDSIQCIEFPTDLAQRFALYTDINTIEKISNPSPDILEYFLWKTRE